MADYAERQSFADKVEAICSLLGCLFAYRDFAPAAMHARRQEWISERSKLDPVPTQPRAVNVDCEGHCFTCWAYYQKLGKMPECPPEEKWVREMNAIRARYRIEELEEWIMKLAKEEPTLAQAVWAVYVEPWPDPRTEPINPVTKAERARLATKGVEWMAHKIPGYVRGYCVDVPTREDQTASLIAEGVKSPSVIAQRLGCSVRHAKRLKRSVVVRCESTAIRS